MYLARDTAESFRRVWVVKMISVYCALVSKLNMQFSDSTSIRTQLTSNCSNFMLFVDCRRTCIWGLNVIFVVIIPLYMPPKIVDDDFCLGVHGSDSLNCTCWY